MRYLLTWFLFSFVFAASSCRTFEDTASGASLANVNADQDIDAIENQTWRNYYPSWFNFFAEDEELKGNLHLVLKSVHCQDPDGENADELIPSPVQEEGGFHYLQWLDRANAECMRKFPGTTAYMHRALGYETRDQVNPRDYPELRNARFYLYHDPRLGHIKEDDKGKYIIDVYAEERYGQEAGVGDPNGRNPDGNLLNCEHTWPKSRFGVRNKGGAGYRERESDLHHLFPTSNSLNNLRSSYYFAEVNGGQRRGGDTGDKVALGAPNLTPMPDYTLPSPRQGDQWATMYFEPPKAHRGNIARALFYFSVRYNLPIEPIEEFYLRKWHRDDPVDEVERIRNNAVAELQQVRNPFIDFPELVEQISDF